MIENKRVQIGLLLGLNVVQHHPAPVKRREILCCLRMLSVSVLVAAAVSRLELLSPKLTLFRQNLLWKIFTEWKIWAFRVIQNVVIVNLPNNVQTKVDERSCSC